MDEVVKLLRKFHVSEVTGFLLKQPLEYLPDYFQQWNFAAKNMPKLVAEKKMRDFVSKMDILDHRNLSSYRGYRLAHLQLSIIASGYVWQDGDKGVINVIPECVAIPLCAVSHYLGIQPSLGHCSFALANWRWSEQENCFKCLYPVPGGEEAEWFVEVTCQVELDFAPTIPCLVMAINNAEQGNVEGLIENLNKLTDTVCKMKKSFSTMHDKLSARTFYNVIRPFLSGWGGEGSPLPDGLIYEGVSKIPMKISGGSAAQSSALHCMDALLGVVHKAGTSSFLMEMRNYMPRAHKDFINWIERRSKVKTFVNKQSCGRLSSAYNACVKSVVDFRSYHIQIVTKYIILMANESNRNKDFDSLATKGTGGSDLLPFLRTLRSSTSDCLTTSDDAVNHKEEKR